MSKENKLRRSETLFKEAQTHLVGGVNSPVRAFRAVGGTPRFIREGKGPYITDVDGHKYIDFVGAWGPLILGHRPDPVMKAVQNTLSLGTSFGAPTEIEVKLASLVKSAYPNIDLLRFTNSGTEATMSALRLARAATKRERILKFEGGYHGHSDSLLVSAGSGATTFGVPSSDGVPETLAKNTWVLSFNDVYALENIFRTQGPNIAAVIVEPVCGNMGVVPPTKEFLDALRFLTKKHGSILIFDEVMTGFRVAWGGAQRLFSVEADITCLGKIIGGGFPVGAFGAKKGLMEKIAPLGPVYQAGTFSGNPVAMAAGTATLQELKMKNPYDELNKKTTELVRFIRTVAKKKGFSVQVNHVGSMFTVFFNEKPVHSYLDAAQSDTKMYAQFFQQLMAKGVYMPPSQFEAAFISTAHKAPVLEKAKKGFADAFDALRRGK